MREVTATIEPTTTVQVVNDDREADQRRKAAILKAVGLDKAMPEQRELAIAIAKRYDLDLMLKHLVLIDGKPYVTRDALLWIAHRDGHLDGIEVTEPVVRDYQGAEYWYCEATVYRSDMSHPFKYGGRYPVKGGNAKFGPEMATKVAESMSLRRAFNISAPTQDERFDVEQPALEPEPEKVEVTVQATDGSDDLTGIAEAVFAPEEFKPLEGPEVPEDGQPEPLAPKAAGMTQCESLSPFTDEGKPTHQCRRETGHKGAHRTTNESWS